jgi:hypothetical protein
MAPVQSALKRNSSACRERLCLDKIRMRARGPPEDRARKTLPRRPQRSSLASTRRDKRSREASLPRRRSHSTPPNLKRSVSDRHRQRQRGLRIGLSRSANFDRRASAPTFAVMRSADQNRSKHARLCRPGAIFPIDDHGSAGRGDMLAADRVAEHVATTSACCYRWAAHRRR